MNSISSRFGLINGLATASCFLGPTIYVGLMLFLGWGSKPAIPLLLLCIGLAIVTKLTGDWLFWYKMFPDEMPTETYATKSWRSSVKDILSSQPDAIRSLLDMLIDGIIDILLIYMALSASTPIPWLFFAFFGCQAVAAPIQGMIIDYSNKRKVRTFYMIITLLGFVLSMGINSEASPPSYYVHLLGLDQFTAPIQMLIVLCAKWLLCGTSTLAKATIAEVIQTEAIKV